VNRSFHTPFSGPGALLIVPHPAVGADDGLSATKASMRCKMGTTSSGNGATPFTGTGGATARGGNASMAARRDSRSVSASSVAVAAVAVCLESGIGDDDDDDGNGDDNNDNDEVRR